MIYHRNQVRQKEPNVAVLLASVIDGKGGGGDAAKLPEVFEKAKEGILYKIQ